MSARSGHASAPRARLTSISDDMSVDYKATVFLPKTDFPMRANLPEREPEILARWQEMDLFQRLRDGVARAGRNSSCMTARPTPTATSISATRSTRS